MATIKSYTDIKQSKKLAEILPLTIADMHYERAYFEGKQSDWFIALGRPIKSDDIIPCWSLAALLNILPNYHITNNGITGVIVWSTDIYSKEHQNLVDACYEMIIRLNELKML